MTTDKGIFIKNVYYMLSYAYKELRSNNYERIAGETFEDIHDLFARILALGIARQLKQGLHREYVEHHDTLPTLRGKLDISGTLACLMAQKQHLACYYDELSEDNLFNQILKATVQLLLKQKDVKDEQKKLLRRNIHYFSNVSHIDLKTVHWDALRFDRNNQNYSLLINVCRFVVDDLLLTTETGNYKMQHFSGEQMHTLFEHFVLEYYKRHHPTLRAAAEQIDWDIDKSQSDTEHLPIMQTDIMLHLDPRTLIIDAKYYGQSFAKNFNKRVLHSSNMYQVHCYVVNKDTHHTGLVDGLLLYAKTSDDMPLSDAPKWITLSRGNRLGYCALDLNKDFKNITQQLDDILNYMESKTQLEHTLIDSPINP